MAAPSRGICHCRRFLWTPAQRKRASMLYFANVFYLAIQRSVWRDIKFAFFVCTVEDISTQDGAIGVKFWLRVEQTPGTGTR